MSHELAGSNVLIVDDAAENLRLLSTVLKRGGLVPRPVTSGKLAVEAAVVDPPDLILLDIRLPDMSGLEVCRWLKRDERLKDIPIIFISGLQDSEDKVEAFRVGGVDYITKPFYDQEVLARIDIQLRVRKLQTESLMQNEQLAQRVSEQVKMVVDAQMATIFALAKLFEGRDNSNGRHVERVQVFSRLLGEQMVAMKLHQSELSPSYLETLDVAACLHDIGMVGIPDVVLLKRTELDAAEDEEIRQHSVLGAETLAALERRFPSNKFLRMAVDVARSHHENWDGSGYPDGLQGDGIPLAARIVGLADFYDSLTAARRHQRSTSHQEAQKVIVELSAKRFDPEIVSAFGAVEDQFSRIREEMGERGCTDGQQPD